MRIPAIITDRSITVTGTDFIPRAIPSSHPNFQRVRDLIEAGADWNQIKDLVDLPRAIASYTSGKIAVVNGVLTYNGAEVNNALSARILSLISDKKEKTAEPLIRFMENVNLNPSMRSVEGLYEWLEKSNLPITPDGCIIAWKIVGPNYKDLYSGRFDNSVGKIVEVTRNQVDENPDRTCSSGLHFCSTEYLPSYGTSAGNRVVVVKIHPRDVVAFPRDYNTSKGRACRYEVIGEIDRDSAGGQFAGINVLRDFGTLAGGEEFSETFDELELGGVYLTREGDEVEIVEQTGHAEFPFKGDNGASYTRGGEYLAGVELPQDLLKRIG